MPEEIESFMGTKKSMLRNYLRLVGFSAIVIGLVFLISSMAISSRTLSNMDHYGFDHLEGTGLDHILFFIEATRGHVLTMINALSLGGVCLYLSFRLSER